MTTKITIAFFLISISFQTFGKNVVPFWKEDFGLGQFPVGWTSYDSHDEPIFWQHGKTYNQSPLIHLTTLGLFPDENFKSASVENGFAFLFPYNKGAALENHVSSIETDVIDCSNKSQVFLTFNTFMMAKYSDPMESAVLEVKNSNSPFWTKFTIFPTLSQNLVEFHPYFLFEPRIQSINGQFICIDISSVAANMDDVVVRWTWNWTGPEEYCWLIDDVELLDENPVDINAVWGAQPGEGDFANGLNNWSVQFNDVCRWNWSPDGLVDYPDASEEADGFGCSCTVTNGVAMMNATCSPSTNTFFYTELVSPKIDLTGVPADKRLGLRFHQSGAIGNNNTNNGLPLTSVMVSKDDGQTFIDTIFLNLVEPFSKPFCKTSLELLPLEVNGSANFVFKFVFSGSNFYWIIDDVRVVEMSDNDLRISNDYFAVAPNYSTPAGLQQPIAFAAEVQNVGNLTQDFTTLNVIVINDSTQEPVFQDTLYLGSLLPGETSPDTFFSKKYLPAPGQSYTGFYTVIGEDEEENLSDNKQTFRFNTIGSTFSKSIDKYAINGGFAINSFDPKYEIGNCFYIPPGAKLAATSMEFAVDNGKFYSNGQTSVDINLYQWKKGDNNGDVNGDLKANQNEYEIITSVVFKFEVEYSLLDVIQVPFFAPIELEEDTYYFVTVYYRSPAISNGHQVPFFIAASEQINYASMFDQSVLCGQPSYTSMLRKFGETAFSANAWGLLRTPFINLNVDMINHVKDDDKRFLSLNLFPNPTTGQLQVSLPDAIDVGGITYEIFDICGRLALPRQNVEGYVSQLPIDVSKLSNGLYNLRVVSGNRVGVHQFVVVGTR